MNQNDIINRIKYLITELGYKQTEFAQKVGVNNSNLSKYLNGRLAVSEALVNRIVVNLGVSKEWLEHGTDLPFAKQTSHPLTMTTTPRVEEHLTGIGAPVYDIDVTAGTLPRTRMFADDLVVGFIHLPDLVSDNCRVVRVSGDSMSPVICDGDYIAVRELTNTRQIFWGEIYVVLLDDLRVVKYIRKHPTDPNMVILRSENPNYDDMGVMRDDIHDLMIVRQVIHFSSRN